ncbi:MAG: hypothetical protein KGJ62_02445 [Armatimonadetes bacterium]|nr:hypothetical protein [Armatimonadota bacterium]MDE2205319.1 hypothetical protein [Armatimonadota bacterium]
MRFRPASTRIAAAAALGGLALALLAGCGKTSPSSTAPAPPAATPANPAAGAPPTTTAGAAGGQAFQPYTVLPSLPPAPAKVVDTNRTLTMVQHSGAWYLRDHDGHYYHVARDSQGHFYPAYTGPNGHYYPLRYDASRNRYFRIIRTSSGDSYRNYVGDPNTQYYQDPGTQYSGQSQLAGYNDPYSQPTYQPTIIKPKSHSNKNLWWLALPVLVGAYLLLKNQHHSGRPNQYAPPSSIVRYYNGRNGSMLPMNGRGPAGAVMANMGMNRSANIGNRQIPGSQLLPHSMNRPMASMGGSFGHPSGGPAHGHFAPPGRAGGSSFTPPGHAFGRQPGFTPPGHAFGRQPGFTPPGHAFGRQPGFTPPGHAFGRNMGSPVTPNHRAPVAHSFAPPRPAFVPQHRTGKPVHSTPFRLQPPAPIFGHPVAHPGNPFGQAQGRGPARPVTPHTFQQRHAPAQPSRFVPHPAAINSHKVAPKGNPFRAPVRKSPDKKKGK